jgi:hypothetical protein
MKAIHSNEVTYIQRCIYNKIRGATGGRTVCRAELAPIPSDEREAQNVPSNNGEAQF